MQDDCLLKVIIYKNDIIQKLENSIIDKMAEISKYRKLSEDAIALNRTLEIENQKLVEKNAKLENALHKKNLQLDALHYVWCSGGCLNGVHKFTPGNITAEIVDLAVKNTSRLVKWWKNHEKNR